MAFSRFSRTIASLVVVAALSVPLAGCFELLWLLGHEDPEIGQMEADDFSTFYPDGSMKSWVDHIDGHTEYNAYDANTGKSGWISVAEDGTVLGRSGFDPRTFDPWRTNLGVSTPVAAPNRPEIAPTVPKATTPRPAVPVPVPHVH